MKVKTADEIERELVAALGGDQTDHYPLLRKLAEREAELWRQLAEVSVKIDESELHKKLDALAVGATIARRKSNEQSTDTPMWNSLEMCWEESDAQLRARIEHGTPVVPGPQLLASERAAYDAWRSRMTTCGSWHDHHAQTLRTFPAAGDVTADPLAGQAFKFEHVSVDASGFGVGFVRQVNAKPVERCPCTCASCIRKDCEYCVGEGDNCTWSKFK